MVEASNKARWSYGQKNNMQYGIEAWLTSDPSLSQQCLSPLTDKTLCLTYDFLLGRGGAGGRPEASRSLQRLPEASRSLQKPPEASRSLQKPPEASRSLQRPPEASRSLQKPPEASRSLQKPPEASRSLQTPPEASRVSKHWKQLENLRKIGKLTKFPIIP